MENIKLITGFYGVGKSEYSINLVKKNNIIENPNILIDLDIINPYFRSREIIHLKTNNSIKIISSSLNGENTDLPAISPEITSVFNNIDKYNNIVVDLGGGIAGIQVIKSLYYAIDKKNIDVYYVMNANRITVDSLDEIINHMTLISDELGIKIKYLVNNTHMLGLTGYEDIIRGNRIAIKIAKLIGIDKDNIINSYSKKIIDIESFELEGEFFPMEIILRSEWMK